MKSEVQKYLELSGMFWYNMKQEVFFWWKYMYNIVLILVSSTGNDMVYGLKLVFL